MTMPRYSEPTRSPRAAWVAVAAAILFAALSLAAQEEVEPPPPAEQLPSDVDVDLVPEGTVRLNLALPRSVRPPAAGPEFLDAMNEVERTLREDLAFTQLFDVQGPEVLSAVRLSGDRARDLEQYRAYGNEVALLT